MMRWNLLVVLSILVTTAGCATSTATGGRDFNSAKVSEIQKGATTGTQLIAMIGEPLSKKAKSENEEEWTYEYAVATAKARSGFFGSMNVDTTGTQKNLSVLLRDGKVINYTYSEGPIGNKVRTQAYK